jgi:hypothetical protein
VPTGGGTVPTALAIFHYRKRDENLQRDVTVTEAGIPGVPGNAFRMYVELSGVPGQSGNIQTGIAVANTSGGVARVNFELTRLDGSATGLNAFVDLPPGGQDAKFLAELFPAVPASFQGVIRITSAVTISVVGVRSRYNERPGSPDFLITTTPPVSETQVQPAAEQSFPQIVNGAGYTTQVILFNGTAGQAGGGQLRFLDRLGAPFNLTLN